MSSVDAVAVSHSRTGRLPRLNRRQRTLLVIVLSAALLLSVVAGGLLLGNEMLTTNLDQRNLSPSLEHPFGTDWLGRDMLARTLKGLTLSLVVGVLASTVSVLIALTLGMAAATFGRAVDGAVTWLVDLFLSVPHLVVLILIAFTLGGGTKGVILAVALTHWPSLTRVIRAEVLQLRTAEFVQVSRRLGRTRWWIATRHLLPHLVPQILVGLVLLFPHAILHEAAITFLGFGLSPQQPAVGVILSESMRHLSTGYWWLALFPGLALLVMVRAFDILGDNLRSLVDPRIAHE
ncbi:MAG: ABC transporter permease [Eubacteriales bacterium]|jgi:peptide/nickel transport system permease protein|nr:ABC transporter permease [Bacillota bacterium]MBV1728627.1 ABC transporter permease [Desulforudis sp.]MDQ7790074.1 ABC transporter permease [Clostridia bacterium]MDZ4043864.1 ABC transporter permease [Eubacteriales bacterium]MBU4533878.1 ABC transporter permease [Bacillota bacterium]